LVSLRGLDQLIQLRQLSAYCCGLINVGDLSENKRLEKLHLQQNLIQEIPFCFRSFNKLRHLRLDKNRLTTIDNLQGCSSLRILDISFNKLESLEGIAGLQSLVELKANNNRITSLKTLRALPALEELQVDENCLTNLDGIQNLPTLVIFHANNNRITRLAIPQTYTHTGVLANAAATSSSVSASRSDSVVLKGNKAETTRLGMAALSDVS
jgi:Leucine-rich repeat (LRR) protein